MISPTVGRVVWLHNAPLGKRIGPTESDPLNQLPFAALVTYPWSDHLINVAYFDHVGDHYALRSAPLVQEGEAKPEGSFCTWMPYQIGQAKKHEPSERSDPAVAGSK